MCFYIIHSDHDFKMNDIIRNIDVFDKWIIILRYKYYMNKFYKLTLRE